MKKLILGILCLAATTVVAQEANFSRAEKFRKAADCVGSLKVEPHYLKGSDRFWYAYETGAGIHWYLVDPARKSHRLLFDNHRLVKLLTEKTGEPFSAQQLKLKNLQLDSEAQAAYFSVNGVRYKYDLAGDSLTTAGKPKYRTVKYPWASYSPDSSYIVYAQRHNLYVMKNQEGVTEGVQLTTDGERHHSYASYDKDTTGKKVKAKITWCGQSNKFYVLREDLRRVEPLWLIDIVGRRPRLVEYRYAMPGEKEVAQFDLQVFDAAQARGVKIDIDRWTDQSVTVAYASEDGSSLYFQRKRRTCEEIEICKANTETGESKVLIQEVAKPYFNDQLYHLSFLNDGQDILWWSERSGWGHYYHYDGEGRLKNAVSAGEWVAGTVVRIDTVGRTLYFEGYGREKGHNPYYTHLYKASLDREGVQLLTPENAHHSLNMSPTHRYFVDNYSRVDLEPRSVVRDQKGRKVMELCRPDLSRLYEQGWSMPEQFTVKAADGVTDLYGVMWKPADFDSTKTYPVISHVYPGPQTESVPFAFSVAGNYNDALAQVGFIVVHFGHRGGSPRRAKWYRTFGHQNLRDYALADDKYGIEQLADRHPYIDRHRVGIFGHSGGGFMSTAALCTYPDFYTAAVSASGNHDNNIYNKWWGETHHGLQEKRETVHDSLRGDYEKSTFSSQIPTNIELAKNLRGHLMLVTGDMDNNVHPAQTLRMVKALMDAGKNFDLVVLPGQGHNFYYTADEFFQRKLWFHFARHLLGDYRSENYFNIDGFDRKG